jgi:universal stress protein E
MRCATYDATSYEAKLDLLYGEGELFQHNVRSHANAKLKQLIAVADASGLDVTYETLLGEPYVEIIHAVQSENYDLVVAGMHGASAWEDLLIGSTAKRLIRKCPCSLWIVTAEHAAFGRRSSTLGCLIGSCNRDAPLNMP